MKQRYIGCAFALLFGFAMHVKCDSNKDYGSFRRNVVLPWALTRAIIPESKVFAYAYPYIDFVVFAGCYIGIWMEGCDKLRDRAWSCDYQVRDYAGKKYVYPPSVWFTLKSIANEQKLSQKKAACFCIEGMPGNGSSELAQLMIEAYGADRVEVDIRSLIQEEPQVIESYFQELEETIKVSDNRTAIIMSDFDLVADYLYAQKTIKHGDITLNAINESLSRLVKISQAVCIFTVRSTSRLEWYFKDVINPRMIRLQYPNEVTRRRLMHYYCELYCGKDLRDICSSDYIDYLVEQSYGFSVQNIASMCERVARMQDSEMVTNATWQKAYCEELEVSNEECNALDAECKIGYKDTVKMVIQKMNNFIYKWSYACGLYTPSLTT